MQGIKTQNTQRSKLQLWCDIRNYLSSCWVIKDTAIAIVSDNKYNYKKADTSVFCYGVMTGTDIEVVT